MGRGALTLYLRTDENEEVAGGAGIPFADDLVEKLRAVLAMSDAERHQWSERAARRVSERYSWEKVTDAYHNLLARLVRGDGS